METIFPTSAMAKLDAFLFQTIAELEQRWQNEVNDIRQGMMPASMAFFADYHLNEVCIC